MSWLSRVSATSVVLLVVAGCGGERSGPSPARPAGPTTAAPQATNDLLRSVCTAEHADVSSTFFLALDSGGKPKRIVVTPSRTIADMGNLIFDMDGKLLGHDTGSEVPWDDKAFMANERARVAGLMAGAAIADGAEPQSCKDHS